MECSKQISHSGIFRVLMLFRVFFYVGVVFTHGNHYCLQNFLTLAFFPKKYVENYTDKIKVTWDPLSQI